MWHSQISWTTCHFCDLLVFLNFIGETDTMATAQSTVMFAVCILMITELILARKDYYDILGVSKDATERQIKKAFHKLAMKLHPDKNKSPDAEAKFREIAEGEKIIFFCFVYRIVLYFTACNECFLYIRVYRSYVFHNRELCSMPPDSSL